MASEQEIRALKKREAKASEARAQSATQSPLRSTGPANFGSVAPPPAPREARPAVEPYAGPGRIDAAEMGGAVDDPNADYKIEYGPDMQPRRVPREPAPGPQSGTFGDLFTSEDANNLVKMVQHDRLARQVASTKAPTIGETGEQVRTAQAEQAAAAAQPPPPVNFVVDTRTGEFEPVLPNQEPPPLGPHDVLLGFGEDPSQPNIMGQGKRVTPQALARLGDPKRGIQPALRKGFQIPPEFQGLAQALGVEQEES